jgi:hypothetical protein
MVRPGENLRAIADLDLEEIAAIQPPRGLGLDQVKPGTKRQSPT